MSGYAESLLERPLCAPVMAEPASTRDEHDPFIGQDEAALERARVARELHDTLLQSFIGASLLLHEAVDNIPADCPAKPTLNRALRLVRRGLDEGRMALQQLRSPTVASTSLEQALAAFGDEFAPRAAPAPASTSLVRREH